MNKRRDGYCFMRSAMLSVWLCPFIVVQAFSIQLREAGHIILSMKEAPLYMGETFAVTEDDMFIVSDYKDGNFKFYSAQGEYIRTWGKPGIGPDEFLSPRYCSYQKPFFMFYDMGRMRIYVYKRIGKTDFLKETEFIQTPTQMDFARIGNEVLIAGHIGVSDKESYALYSRNIKNDDVSYLMSNHTKFGYSSRAGFLAKGEEVGFFGSAGYCDYYGDYVYLIWEGNLKVFKIKLTNKEISSFGEPSSGYRKPRMNRALRDADRIEDSRKSMGRIFTEKQKMSFITGIFADMDYVGVVYENYDKKESLWKASLQLYSLKGELILDCPLPGAVRASDFRNRSIQYDKVKKRLFYLSITSDKSSDFEKYEIYKYQLMN
ncbi:MAG: hypothetical protein ACYDH0_05990 [Candidatus Aminicenantales bacterium]